MGSAPTSQGFSSVKSQLPRTPRHHPPARGLSSQCRIPAPLVPTHFQGSLLAGHLDPNDLSYPYQCIFRPLIQPIPGQAQPLLGHLAYPMGPLAFSGPTYPTTPH